MKKVIYNNKHLTGERALYKTSSAIITNCTFDDGESPLKESSDLEINHCVFGWKYPLWYSKNITLNNSLFLENARAGVWYTKHSTFSDLIIQAPKTFRRSNNLVLNDITFEKADETLWWCSNIQMQSITAKGDYLFMQSKNIVVNNLTLDGNYAFDGCKNVKITNSVLHTKDAFWNCENIIIENCEIIGEYFGWNSKNVTLKHCKIKSHQGFCYMKGIKLIDCEIIESDLIFEFCKDIDADINSDIDSIKNPYNGHIKAKSIKNLIRDPSLIDSSLTTIEVQNAEGNYHEI